MKNSRKISAWLLPFLGTQLLFGKEPSKVNTATPIKYLVVIYQENRSFDHYFGTYPIAENKPGETPFHPKKGTSGVNGFSPALLTINQNLIQPYRLAPSQANTEISDKNYAPLQEAYYRGTMAYFVKAGSTGSFSSVGMGIS